MVIDGRQGLPPRRRTATGLVAATFSAAAFYAAALASAAVLGVCPLAAWAAPPGKAPADTTAPAADNAAAAAATAAASHCLPSGDGYLRAHVAGAVEARIDWPDQGTRCEGESKGAPLVGVRLSFQRAAVGDSKLGN